MNMNSAIETAKEKIETLKAKYAAGKSHASRMSEGNNAEPETFGFWTKADDDALASAVRELHAAELATWTRELTIERRVKWNTQVRARNVVTVPAIKALEAELGFTNEMLRAAIKSFGM